MSTESDPEIRTLHLETLRTARVALLGDRPESPVASEELWYLFHGYRQLAHRFLARFRSIASRARLLVAPEGASRFYVRRSGDAGHSSTVGASWMTREDREHEIRDYVRYLNAVARSVEGARPPGGGRIALGFSQGVHTAARWAVMGRVYPVSRLILWGTPLPSDLPDGSEVRMQELELTLVRGRTDALRKEEEEEREEAWLERRGVSYRVEEHPGGHEIDLELLSVLADRS